MNLIEQTVLEKEKDWHISQGMSEEEYNRRVGEMQEDKKLCEIREVLKTDKPKGVYLLAVFCAEKFHAKTIKNVTFIYKEGIYIEGDSALISFIQKDLALEQQLNNHLIGEFLGYVKRLSFVNDIIEPENLICIRNGILRLETLQVTEYNPDFIFFNKIPASYNKDADCPLIKKFISEVVSPEDSKLLQELAGYCLYKKYSIHKAFMLTGQGANGKSTFINLIKSFLGKENCSSIPLQQLEENRFATSQLFGKMANLFADLSPKALKQTSLFKMLTGEDMTPAERKFKDGFSFQNYAKLIFSCNQIPRNYDDTDAFFRRWVIINFPNQFLNNADTKLIDKLTVGEELSGFLNYAIEGLKRLLEKGKFSDEKSISETRESYLRMSDSVASFVLDCVLASPEDYISKKELYGSYCDYCRQTKSPPVAENTFHRRLQAQVRVEDYRPKVEGKLTHCWKGINIHHIHDIHEICNFKSIESYVNKEGKNVDNLDILDISDPKTDTSPKEKFQLKDLIKTETTYHKCTYQTKCPTETCEWQYKNKPICNNCAKIIQWANKPGGGQVK